MSKLTEKDFPDIKEELKTGRISPEGIRAGLGAFMFFSALMIGIAYLVVNASNTVIGWDNLSFFWQTVFKLQVVLFILQLLLIFIARGRSNRSQIALNVSFVLYTYKTVLDPFIMTLMFAKDRGVYNEYAPLVGIIILLGFILHFYLVFKAFQNIRNEQGINREVKKEKNNKSFFTVLIPFVFLVASITGYIVKNDLLGENEILFGVGISTLVFIAILIGAIEFVKGAYCVIRFPSFRVNPPSTKKKKA